MYKTRKGFFIGEKEKLERNRINNQGLGHYAKMNKNKNETETQILTLAFYLLLK